MSLAPTVALYHGSERQTNLRQTLAAVIDQVPWADRQCVVVKPNLVWLQRPYAITHREALAVVLEAIRARYTGPLFIAEGCALTPTWETFEAQDYPALARFYQCELVDLNQAPTQTYTVYDQHSHPLEVRVARLILDSDCRVSLALPKTHDAVLATLSIKNILMGSLVNRRLGEHLPQAAWHDRLGQIVLGHGNGWGSDKVAMHQGYPMMNINLAKLAPLVWPHLSVLDGFIAMEGAGPLEGEPVAWGLAFAGTDALAVDTLAAHLMGFQLAEIGYLHYCAQQHLGCAELDKINVHGNVQPATIRRVFKRHPQAAAQRIWQVSYAADFLENPQPPDR